MCSHFNIEEERKYATIWHIMLYCFKKGNNATDAKKIYTMYGEDDVTNKMCQKWFALSS